jgi:hypothetical protein
MGLVSQSKLFLLGSEVLTSRGLVSQSKLFLLGSDDVRTSDPRRNNLD